MELINLIKRFRFEVPGPPSPSNVHQSISETPAVNNCSFGATTFDTTTLSIRTLSVMSPGIKAPNITIENMSDECSNLANMMDVILGIVVGLVSWRHSFTSSRK